MSELDKISMIVCGGMATVVMVGGFIYCRWFL